MGRIWRKRSYYRSLRPAETFFPTREKEESRIERSTRSREKLESRVERSTRTREKEESRVKGSTRK